MVESNDGRKLTVQYKPYLASQLKDVLSGCD